MNKKNLKLVKITEDLSDKIYDMFQEIPFQEDYQDINVANGLNKNEFRKYCVVLELASKNIMLDYIVPVVTWYVLFEKDEPIGWFCLEMVEKIFLKILFILDMWVIQFVLKKENRVMQQKGLSLL